MIDIQHSNERNFCGAITPKEKDKIMKAILDMAAHERKTFCFTPNDVPNLKINGKQFEMVIMDFFEKGYIIRDLKWSTKRAHLIALEALKRSGVIKTFDDITPENIALFDRFIRREDPTRGQTTIHGYHKRIKPYINEALRLGLIEDTPYRVFKDKHGRYKTRQPLTMDELQSIRNIELNDRQLQKVRDQFIFQCYTGLSWVDLYMFDYDRCTVEHNGVAYIDGERIKTGTKFYTPILTPAMEILKKYDYKFTVPTVQSFNRSLKIIAELIGLKKPLTSHIARHTFATTVVLANDVPIETLSKMLGHTKVSVTQVYAKILNSSVEKHAEKLNSII